MDKQGTLRKLAFLDEGLTPAAAGLAGGAGGYLAGKHLVNPVLEMKKRSILEKMLRGEEMVKKLETGTKYGPLAAATIGAILLAGIAANRARKSERERIEQQLLYAQLQQVMEARGGAGFSPEDQVRFGDPSGGVY